MMELPPEWVTGFDRRLDKAKVPPPLRQAYHKWVKFYPYFCQKFGYPATAPTALGPFLTKLADKNHSIDDRHHAATAVRLLLRYDPQDPNLYLPSNQEVRGFLSSLVVQRGVSASSQNQAFNALLFLFRHVLHREFGEIDDVVPAKRHRYIPVAVSGLQL
jgi:hypothetical protein